MYKVYAIKSHHRRYIYVGMTTDLPRRLREHNQGHERTTRTYAPFHLFYEADFTNRIDARLKEKQLKSGAGKEFLKSLL